MIGHTRMLLAVFALAVGLESAARAQEPARTTGERLKDDIRDAAGAVGRAGRGVADSVRAGFVRTKDLVHNMNVEARVYGRLHWDKGLEGSEITLDRRKDGTIVMHGVVPTAEAKVRAIALANETLGVTKVDDQLAVGTATTTKTTIETKKITITPGGTETSKTTDVVRPKP